MLQGLVSMACLRFAAAALAAALPAAPSASVPVARQAALLLKVLSADRNLAVPSPAGLAIGIVYERTSPASREVAEQFAAELGRLEAGDGVPPVRWALLDVSDPAGLAAAVASFRPGVLYVAPLPGLDVGRIAALTRARRIRSATGVPAYVEAGLAVGFESERGAARILINLEASRAEGADFSSKLLKHARRVP